MSEEEKEAIKYMKEFQKDLYGASSKNLMASYLDTIFNLIENQQKEIEEEHKKWKELLHEYGVKCQEIEKLKEKQDYARLEKEQLLEDSISKDKIKEKIKELQEKPCYAESVESVLEEIDILKKLLEE